jgi:hypothetical protein
MGAQCEVIGGESHSSCFYFETVGRAEMRKAGRAREEHRVSPTVDLLRVFGLVRTRSAALQASRARSPTHSLASRDSARTNDPRRRQQNLLYTYIIYTYVLAWICIKHLPRNLALMR